MKMQLVYGICGTLILAGFAVAAANPSNTAVAANLAAVASPQQTPPPNPPSCNTSVDNPHVSGGAGGIIVKSRTVCYNSVAQMRVGLDLYQCPRKPTGDKDTWGSQGCAIVKAGGRTVYSPVDGTTYTNYAPPTGSVGAHGTGYWAGVAFTSVYNSAGTNIGYGRTVGAPVPLTG